MATGIAKTAAKLLELDQEITDIDKTIAERFRDYPYARMIESLPGFGPHLVPNSRSSPAVFYLATLRTYPQPDLPGSSTTANAANASSTARHCSP